jgi:hypothetical protein
VQLVPLFTLEVEIDGLFSAGKTPFGELRLLPFSKGRFEGEGFSGKVMPGGTDWQQVRADGVTELAARYLLETDEREVIEVNSVGVFDVQPGVLERFGRGEKVAASEYYFRTHVRFRTASPRLARLNSVLAVSHAELAPGGVRLQMFEVP